MPASPMSRRTKLGAGKAFSPGDIASLQAWYEADSLALADGTAVGSLFTTWWPDRSVLADHLVQATLASRPILKTNICNGLPVVRFNGTSNTLQGFSAFYSGTAWSAFIIFAPGNTSAGYVAAWYPDSSHRSIIQQYAAGTAETYSTPRESLGGVATGVFHLHEWVDGAVNSVGYRDGVQAASVATDGPGNLPNLLTLGSSSPGTDFFNGDIAAFLFYNTELGTADRQSVEGYLRAKWGTP